MNEYILGITGKDGFTHDNSAAVVKNGEVLFASSEERYSRIKHDGSFPCKAIESALSFLKLDPTDINTLAAGYPPRNTLSVIYHRYFYDSLLFALEILVYRHVRIIKDIWTFGAMARAQHTRAGQSDGLFRNRSITYVDHYVAHAASAYYMSGYDRCITLVLDGFGPQLSGHLRAGAVYLCENGKMTEVHSVPIYGSIGLFYTAITLALGFTPGDGEGKTMGLAAYGDPKKLYSAIKPFCPSFMDGRWRRGKDWLSGFLTSMPRLHHLFYSTRFGKTLSSVLKKEKKETVAAAAQKIVEEEIYRLVSHICEKYPGTKNICLAGGLFLNVKANKGIMEMPFVDSIFVHPHAGDGGVAVGAALWVSSQACNKSVQKAVVRKMNSGGLGQSFTNAQILTDLEASKVKIAYERREDIAEYAAQQLVSGKVLGWFQGRAEWGPRALGFRSVLADPRDIMVKDRINRVLKNREWFMPFAPSVLEEEAPAYFKNCKRSPFMTAVFDVMPGKEGAIPAAIHIDNTARPNTVNRNNNELYYRLLAAFYKKTGLPVILNTSFNLHGLPIVNSPQDAIDHLLRRAVDELIIGDYSVVRR